MNISRESLHFDSCKSILTVQLYNCTSGSLIYKIRTNKLDYFMIRPGRGILAPGKTVTVQVGTNLIFEGKYRMQVAYCETEGTPQDDFNQLWRRLNKDDITNEFLTLDCQPSGNGTLKATDSPVISGAEERECAKSQSSSISLDPLKIEPLKKSHTMGQQHYSNTMFQTVSEEGGMLNSVVSPIRCDSGTVLKELAREKETNQDLREKLREKNEQMESLRSRVVQGQINRSMRGDKAQTGCFSAFNVFIGVFLCLLLGFCIGKASG